MKVPPPGERHVAANWLAAGVSLASVIVGTSLLLSAGDRIPDQVALHWKDGQTDIQIELSKLLLAAGLVIVLCSVLILVGGRFVAGSWRHTWAPASVSTSLAAALLLYGSAWAQRNGPLIEPPIWVFFGFTYGILAGRVLATWVRGGPLWWRKSPTTSPATPVPPALRVAWVGKARMAWRARLSSSIAIGMLTLLMAWWTDAWALIAVMGGVVLAVMFSVIRTREVAVDYSGVGLRGATDPAPIKMADVRGVSVGTVHALRDFGGWGHKVAANGVEGWISRSGEALVVHRWDKPDFVFTVDDAAEAAAVLNNYLARSEVA